MPEDLRECFVPSMLCIRCAIPLELPADWLMATQGGAQTWRPCLLCGYRPAAAALYAQVSRMPPGRQHCGGCKPSGEVAAYSGKLLQVPEAPEGSVSPLTWSMLTRAFP